MEFLNKVVEPCANVYLIHDRKVLLIKHPKSHNYVGVGGHKEVYESLYECAVRETFEESRIMINTVDCSEFDIQENPRPLCSYLFELGNHLHDVSVFVFKTDQSELKFETPDQIGGWYSFEESTYFTMSEFTSRILKYLKARNIID